MTRPSILVTGWTDETHRHQHVADALTATYESRGVVGFRGSTVR